MSEEPYIEIYSGIDTDNKRILAANNIKPNISMYAKDSYTAFAMVEAGLGIALNEEKNCVFKSKSNPSFSYPKGGDRNSFDGRPVSGCQDFLKVSD